MDAPRNLQMSAVNLQWFPLSPSFGSKLSRPSRGVAIRMGASSGSPYLSWRHVLQSELDHAPWPSASRRGLKKRSAQKRFQICWGSLELTVASFLQTTLPTASTSSCESTPSKKFAETRTLIFCAITQAIHMTSVDWSISKLTDQSLLWSIPSTKFTSKSEKSHAFCSYSPLFLQITPSTLLSSNNCHFCWAESSNL